jgi:hypothetical protein
VATATTAVNFRPGAPKYKPTPSRPSLLAQYSPVVTKEHRRLPRSSDPAAMAAELPQGKELLIPASAAQEGHLKVYRRCSQRHVRVSSSSID